MQEGGPLRTYDWFGASRVIEGTINEFPAFSFTLADLHGHVMAIPFSLLALAFGLQLALAGPAPPPRGPAALELGVAAIAIGTLYAINAWSFPVVAGLVLLGGAVRAGEPGSLRERGRALVWALAALLLAVIAVLPFLLSYDAAADGFASVTERASFSSWAGDHFELYGLFAYLVFSAYLVKLARSRHPWRTAGWLGALALFAGSLLATADLAAVAGLAALGWVAAHAAFLSRSPVVERYTWVLIGGGLLCLLIPELVYVRDSFDGSDLYRMNTVFKLGFQAWLLLAIAGSVAIVWSWGWLGRRGRIVQLAWGLPLLALLALAAVYPVAGTYARKDGFSDSPRLGGLRWLEVSAPGDPGAIEWLQRERAERLGRARGGRRRLLRVRPRADLDLHRAPDAHGLARPRAAVGPRPGRPAPRGAGALPGDRRGGGARAARPLRRPLRGRRPARARGLRRRGRREVGRAGRARVRRGRHDRLGAAVIVLGDPPEAWERLGFAVEDGDRRARRGAAAPDGPRRRDPGGAGAGSDGGGPGRAAAARGGVDAAG